MINTWYQSFIQPLRKANPPVIRPDALEDFIEEVFGNILDLRECNRRLLEVMYVRQREQAPVIQRIGDVFLDAATEFRLAYPIYVGHLPLAEKRMKEEIETNPEFRLFLEVRCRFFFSPSRSHVIAFSNVRGNLQSTKIPSDSTSSIS
jgi:RHO1 GDP-GTP exchange protein 1/2